MGSLESNVCYDYAVKFYLNVSNVEILLQQSRTYTSPSDENYETRNGGGAQGAASLTG